MVDYLGLCSCGDLEGFSEIKSKEDSEYKLAGKLGPLSLIIDLTMSKKVCFSDISRKLLYIFFKISKNIEKKRKRKRKRKRKKKKKEKKKKQ